MGAVCGAALWKGGWEERSVAFGLLFAWIATLLLRDPRWIGPQWGAFSADVALLVFLGVVAMRTTRYWPLFAAGFHLLAVVTHSARMLDPTMGAWAYATAAVIWAHLVIISLAVGTWNHWREETRAQVSAASGS